jgi:hypothetical protein
MITFLIILSRIISVIILVFAIPYSVICFTKCLKFGKSYFTKKYAKIIWLIFSSIPIINILALYIMMLFVIGKGFISTMIDEAKEYLS